MIMLLLGAYPKLLTGLTPGDYCEQVFKLDGCGEKCAQSQHYLSMSDIWTAHQRFQHLGSFQQRQWVLDYLHSNSSKESKETIFLIVGKSVCLPVWLGVLGLSKSRLYEVRKAFHDGILFVERLTSSKFHQHKSYEAIAWMRQYFNQIGDHMPDRMAIHLPSFLTHSNVYGRMKEDLESRNKSVISCSHFYNLWTSEFSHVTIPKVQIISIVSYPCRPI